MNHPETHLVMPDAERPAGKPGECFYCQRKTGDTHKADCVLRRRSVVVRVTIEYPIAVPEDWMESDIVFHRTDSSWCAGNLLRELGKFDDPDDKFCLCQLDPQFEFVREATAEDEKTRGFSIDY